MILHNPRPGDTEATEHDDRAMPYRTGRKLRNHIYAVDMCSDDYTNDVEIAVAFDAEDGVMIVDALNAVAGYPRTEETA